VRESIAKLEIKNAVTGKETAQEGKVAAGLLSKCIPSLFGRRTGEGGGQKRFHFYLVLRNEFRGTVLLPWQRKINFAVC